MRRSLQSSIAIYALLVAACLTVVDGIPRPVTFVWFAVVFAAVLWWAWRDGSLTIAAHPSILAGVLLVWFALTIGFLGSPSASGLLRLGAFIGVSGGLLFVFPNTFTPAAVYRAVAWVGASFVAVALPTTIIGELGPLSIWRTATLFDVPYFVPTSVFDNPNMLGAIAAVGGIGAVGELLSARTTKLNGYHPLPVVWDGVIAEVLAVICGLGVVLSTGRGALLTLFAGIGVLLLIYGFGRDVAAGATVVGGLFFVGAIVVAAGFLPGPEIFRSIDLSGRGELWRAVIDAMGKRPLFGFGPGAGAETLGEFLPSDFDHRSAPHSSYFRMFFIGGFVGGLGYLLLSLSALRTALADATRYGATTAAMLVGISILLVFNGATLFGLHPISVVGALTVGFVQLSARDTRSIQATCVSLPEEITAAMETSVFVAAVKTSAIINLLTAWRRN